MDRRAFLRRSAPLALVGLAGCTGGDSTPDTEETPTPTATTDGDGTGGGEGDDTPTATDESADSPTETLEPTDSPTPDPTDSPTATEASTPTPQPDQEVVVGPDGNLEFSPETFTVSTGDTVRWRWDSGGHNVSPTSVPGDASWTGKDASTYAAGTTHVHTFEAAGTYEYVCTPHQSVGMRGSFTVE
jgi:plastocyanin